MKTQIIRPINKSLNIILAGITVLGFLVAPFLAIADESLSISATVVDPDTPNGGGGGGNVGGGSFAVPQTSVRFSGDAYPGAFVHLVKNGEEVATNRADNTGYFSITLVEKYDGHISYSVYATDPTGLTSPVLNFPLVVTEGYLTYLSGVRLPPTIATDKLILDITDDLVVSGYALPNSQLNIIILGKIPKSFTTTVLPDGSYRLAIPMIYFNKGLYQVYAGYEDSLQSSKLLSFSVNVEDKKPEEVYQVPGDCNFDGRINLIDFSVLAFWYKKKNPPACLDLNRDHIINLIDFSIYAFYWTG